MKKTYIILCAALFIAQAAVAQKAPKTETGGVTTSNVERSSADDKTVLSLTFDIKGRASINTTQGLELVPLISDSTNTVDFPYILINGKNQNKMYKRRLKFGNSALTANLPDSVIVVGRKHVNTKIDYTHEIQTAPWMENAALYLRTTVISPAGVRYSYVTPLGGEGKTTVVEKIVEVEKVVEKVVEVPVEKIVEVEKVVERPVYQTATQQYTAQPYAAQPYTEQPQPVQRVVEPIYRVVEPIVEIPVDREIPQVITIASTEAKSTYRVEGTAFLDFELNSSNLILDYNNNAQEMSIIQKVMNDVARTAGARITLLEITGYSSPDGRYLTNASLARDRARSLARYIQNAYGVPTRDSKVVSVPEDWDGLRELVEGSSLPYREEVLILDVIDNNLLAPDAKESRLRRMNDGATWQQMADDFFPQLRRVKYRIEYDVEN